jgi:hypothetical protein
MQLTVPETESSNALQLVEVGELILSLLLLVLWQFLLVTPC